MASLKKNFKKLKHPLFEKNQAMTAYSTATLGLPGAETCHLKRTGLEWSSCLANIVIFHFFSWSTSGQTQDIHIFNKNKEVISHAYKHQNKLAAPWLVHSTGIWRSRFKPQGVGCSGMEVSLMVSFFVIMSLVSICIYKEDNIVLVFTEPERQLTLFQGYWEAPSLSKCHPRWKKTSWQTLW